MSAEEEFDGLSNSALRRICYERAVEKQELRVQLGAAIGEVAYYRRTEALEKKEMARVKNELAIALRKIKKLMDTDASQKAISVLKLKLLESRRETDDAKKVIKSLRLRLRNPRVEETAAARYGWRLWILASEPRVVKGKLLYEGDNDEDVPPMPPVFSIDGPIYDSVYRDTQRHQPTNQPTLNDHYPNPTN